MTSRIFALLGLLSVSACRCGAGPAILPVCGISVTPSTADFGALAVGQSLTLPVTLHNSGTAPLTLDSVVASGDDNFQVQSLATSELLAGSSVEIQVTFEPSSAGSHTATLTITTDDSCSMPTSTVVLTGIGITYGVSFAPSGLDFGCVAPNSQAAAQTVTLTNDSDPPEAETVTLTLSGLGDFQISPPDTQLVLDAGATYQFTVTFSPSTIGLSQATWLIDACGGDGGCPPLSLHLSGTGSSTVLVATPDAGDFGFVPIGDTASMGFAVQAQALPAGTSCALPLIVDLPGLELGDAGFTLFLDAGVDGGWPTMLTPPAAFPFAVAFAGQDGGTYADQVVVPYSMVGQSQNPSTLTVPLNANAGFGPCQDLSVTPPSVAFGTVVLGQTVTQSVTVGNPGTSLCEVSAVDVTHNDAYGEFTIGDGGTAVPFVLTHGQTAQVDVAFTNLNVSAPSSRDGTLTLATSAIGGPDGGGFAIPVPLSATVEQSLCGNGVPPGGTSGSTCQNNYAAEVLADCPTLYYRFDEPPGATTVIDSSGNGQDGTYLYDAGTITLGDAGMVGTCASFSGGGLAEYVPTSVIYGNYTVELWTNEASAADGEIVSTRQGPNPSGGFDIQNNYFGSGGVHGDIYSATAILSTSADSPVVLPLGQWSHIVYVVTPTGYTIYQDGVATGTGSYGGSSPLLWTNGDTFDIAGSAIFLVGSFNYFYDGAIDELAVYPTALSAARVLAHFQAGSCAGP